MSSQDNKKQKPAAAAKAVAGDAASGTFISEAMIGNLYELEASRIALGRARSDHVRGLAAMMIDDHETAAHQLQSTLRSMPKPPKIPTEMDKRRAEMLDRLRDADDAGFDGRFLEQQEMAHKENLTLFMSFADNGDNPMLRQFAVATIPALERHLGMVKAVQ